MSVAEFESSAVEDVTVLAVDTAADLTGTWETTGWTPTLLDTDEQAGVAVLAAIELAAGAEDTVVRLSSLSGLTAEEQWEHLVGAHADSLWRFALNLGLAEPAAEAVCELAWLRLAQRWSPIGGHSDEQVREWLEETVCWESRAYRRQTPEVRRPRLRLVPTPS